MISIYPACFFKEKKGYTVIFPDLNWLATGGKNEHHAMEMAIECLAGYLYTSKRDGEEIPKASAMKDVSPAKVAEELGVEVGEAYVTLVSVDVDEYAKKHFEKCVRKTLTIPAWLNEAALERKINFSQVLQEALLKKIRS